MTGMIAMRTMGAMTVCCGLLGIPAWLMGNADLKEMAAGTMDPAGQGTTSAGKVCGIIGTVLAILGALVGIAYLVVVVLMASAMA